MKAKLKSVKIFTLGIRQKMLAILLLVLFVSISISSWYTLHKQEQDIYDAISLRGEEIIKHASRAITLYVVSYDYHSIQLLLDEVVTSHDILHTHVTSAKGNIMASAGPVARQDEKRPRFERPIKFDDKVVGKMTVELDPQDIVRRVEESRNNLLLREFFIIIMVAIGEFIALSFIIARPVAVISNALQESVDEEGIIHKEIPLRSRDEFGTLASQYNLMREQLNTAHSKLRSRIQAADKRLLQTNQALLEQSQRLRDMNQQLKLLSITDGLTNMYNRRYFEEVMTKEIAVCQSHHGSFSLLILDVDHFKKINDNYGHSTGDEVLRKLAGIIRLNTRASDIACRIGGEEFAVACPGTNIESARQLAERLRVAVEKSSMTHNDEEFRFTISVGIETIDEDGGDSSNIDSVFGRADTALYYSKEHGRNRITHYDALPKMEKVS